MDHTWHARHDILCIEVKISCLISRSSLEDPTFSRPQTTPTHEDAPGADRESQQRPPLGHPRHSFTAKSMSSPRS